MIVRGLNKTTLLDYPGHLACTIFLGGCNFCCKFCHNKSLVLSPTSQPAISEEEIFEFLNKRKNILQGVCITGGEPTLSPDLSDFIKKIRALGFKIKLDTNGYDPSHLSSIISDDLVDMVAMDIKCSKNKYVDITGIKNLNIDKIDESIQIIMNSSINYEFRTTVVEEFFSEEDFHSIGNWIKSAKAYYLQSFVESDSVIQKGLHSPSAEAMERYRHIMSQYVTCAKIRGE